MRSTRTGLIWGLILTVILGPLSLALFSPLLAWRDGIYIAAGVAGILAFGLMFLQPLLMGASLPGLPAHRQRRLHLWTGRGMVALVLAHVAGLWVTSPPDVVDVLLFRSPTPFSIWGALAMWGLFAVALLAALRRRKALRWRVFSRAHTALAALVVTGTVLHAALIEGTMEQVSKAALCLAVLAVMGIVVARTWRRTGRARQKG